MPGTRLNKSQFVEMMVQKSGLSKKEVAAALAALNSTVAQQLGKRGPGEVVIPGLLRLAVVEKPATAEHEGINPFTKAPMTYKARPARKVIRVRPLKGLKDAVQISAGLQSVTARAEGVSLHVQEATDMKILMVYPEFPDTFWSFKHALKFVRKKAGAPPLGLLTVAAMLPPHWEKRLVDLNVTSLRDEDLKWADYVFLSAMVVQRESARGVIDRCTKGGVKVVAGGPLFTMEHEKFPDVDHFVLNEAEMTLAPFMRDLEQGHPERVYASPEFPDIHQTPVPLWGLANLRNYDTVSIQFSRGCPFDCDFCNVTALLGHMPRTKTAAQIIAELDSLYAIGWRKSIFFVDDNFIGNKKHIKTEVLPALIEWRKGKSGMPFSTEASINLADDPVLLRLMVEAGFDTVFVGIETPSPEGLAECNKNQNQGRNLVESVKRLQRAGLQVQGGFIVGFDSDPASIFQQQIDFIQQSGIVTAMVGLLQAPLGTRLHERMRSEGRLVREFSGDNVDGSTNIVPKMGLDSLREGYGRILRHIYAPKFYYERVATFLREYQPPKIRLQLEPQYILALWRSIYQLGIRGAERVQYWRLFFWTLFRRPRLFPVAITLAIYGYHFRQVASLHVN